MKECAQRPAKDRLPLLPVTLVATLLLGAGAQAQGFLENPRQDSFESGVSLVSGWHCDADLIEVQFDDLPPVEAAYGTPREDLQDVCGDADNGFGLLINYNLLGDGRHSVKAFADGVQFASATFEVATLGEPFVRDLNAQTEITLLDVGKEVELTWQQSKQGFAISRVEEADFTMQELVQALGGDWVGSWNSADGAGSISLRVGESSNGNVQISQLALTDTGCARNSASPAELTNVDDPLVEFDMTDGSRVELELLGTESLTTLGGSFWFFSGPCTDTDGVFYLVRQ
jgi:hypothetical protein